MAVVWLSSSGWPATLTLMKGITLSFSIGRPMEAPFARRDRPGSGFLKFESSEGLVRKIRTMSCRLASRRQVRYPQPLVTNGFEQNIGEPRHRRRRLCVRKVQRQRYRRKWGQAGGHGIECGERFWN